MAAEFFLGFFMVFYTISDGPTVLAGSALDVESFGTTVPPSFERTEGTGISK